MTKRMFQHYFTERLDATVSTFNGPKRQVYLVDSSDDSVFNSYGWTVCHEDKDPTDSDNVGGFRGMMDVIELHSLTKLDPPIFYDETEYEDDPVIAAAEMSEWNAQQLITDLVFDYDEENSHE